jgi:hypothetical protein
MSNKSIISKSSINTLKKSHGHTIPCRIEFIKSLLKGNTLEPLINLDNTETENFIGGNISDSENSYDTRKSLNKKIHNFNNVINKIGGKLEYKKSGSTGHTFKGTINDGSDEINYAVKVVAYPRKEKYGSIHDGRRPENAELMMIKVLSYFVLKHQTPHIVLPIGTFNTDIKNFVTLVDDEVVDKDEHHRYVEFVDRYKKNYYHDKASILISEWANRGDLLDFMRKNYKKFTLIHWKVIFFQVLSVLAVIQSKFPAFRHNDLKANNILIHKIERRKKYTQYTIVNNVYSCPNIGYIVKLWDFDFACIPGIVDNSKVSSEWTKALNVIPEQNKYYDMHYFFNTLIKKGFLHQIITDSENVPDEVREFIYRIIPEKYRNKGKYVSKNGRILVTEEITTPNDILMKDEFFESFRINKKTGKKKENKENINDNENKQDKTKDNKTKTISNKKTNKVNNSNKNKHIIEEDAIDSKGHNRINMKKKEEKTKETRKTEYIDKEKSIVDNLEIDDINLEDLLN